MLFRVAKYALGRILPLSSEEVGSKQQIPVFSNAEDGSGSAIPQQQYNMSRHGYDIFSPGELYAPVYPDNQDHYFTMAPVIPQPGFNPTHDVFVGGFWYPARYMSETFVFPEQELKGLFQIANGTMLWMSEDRTRERK